MPSPLVHLLAVFTFLCASALQVDAKKCYNSKGKKISCSGSSSSSSGKSPIKWNIKYVAIIVGGIVVIVFLVMLSAYLKARKKGPVADEETPEPASEKSKDEESDMKVGGEEPESHVAPLPKYEEVQVPAAGIAPQFPTPSLGPHFPIPVHIDTTGSQKHHEVQRHSTL